MISTLYRHNSSKFSIVRGMKLFDYSMITSISIYSHKQWNDPKEKYTPRIFTRIHWFHQLVLDCPQSNLGQVRGFFSGPKPGPQVRSTRCLALNLNLSGPRPEGSGQVQSRSGPGPQCLFYISFSLGCIVWCKNNHIRLVNSLAYSIIYNCTWTYSFIHYIAYTSSNMDQGDYPKSVQNIFQSNDNKRC